MKLGYYFLIASLILIFLSCRVTSGKKNAAFNKYVIVSYHLENLFDTINKPGSHDDAFTPEGKKQWNTQRYTKKIKDISRVLSSIGNQLPTLIALCDAENQAVLEDLAKHISVKNAPYKVISVNNKNDNASEPALLYRSNAFRVRNYEAIPIADAQKNIFGNHHILYVKGDFFDKQTFHIFVNHWEAKHKSIEQTEKIRLLAAKILRNQCDAIFKNTKDAHIIIAGNFNDLPKSRSLKKVLRASDNTHNLAYNDFYNVMYPEFLDGAGTYSEDYQWFMLDNIIVSQSLTTGKPYRVGAGKVFNDKSLLYFNAKANSMIPFGTFSGNIYLGGYSNHLPVYVELKREK